MKPLHLPSGLSVVIDTNWNIQQVVAVTDFLQDLLHIIRNHYQGELYAYGETNWTTQCEDDGLNNDEGVPF